MPLASHFTRGEREAQRASGRTLEPGGGLEGDTRLRPDPVPGSGDVGLSEGARGETGSSPVFVSKALQEVLLKHRGGRSRRSESAGGNMGQVSFQKIHEGCFAGRAVRAAGTAPAGARLGSGWDELKDLRP